MRPGTVFWNARRVCVTGGAGFLGSHVVQALLDRGANVQVLDLPQRKPNPILCRPNVRIVTGDVCDIEAVRRATAGCDVIFHLAGPVAHGGPSLLRMYAVHIAGTRNVCNLAPAGARIVHTSSVVAVGANQTREPLTETSPYNLGCLRVDYVQAKRVAEKVALEATAKGKNVVIVNPCYVIGPEDYGPSVMGRLCLRFWNGRLPMVFGHGFNFVDVRDAAVGHLLAAEYGQPGRRYILGGTNCTTRDFFERLAQVANLAPRTLLSLPDWAALLIGRLAEWKSRLRGRTSSFTVQGARINSYFWFFQSDRAVAELGYQPRELDETLSDTLHWFRSQDRLGLDGLRRWWMRPQTVARCAA